MLLEIQQRIKGSKLYSKFGRDRLYIPYRHNFKKSVKADVWIEVVDDKAKLFCKVASYREHPNWCAMEADKIREYFDVQLHEIIHKCELRRRKIPLHIRLQDDTLPILDGAMLHQENAIRFLCTMSVSALFADVGTGKTFIAIRLAQSRYKAGKIKKLHVFCPVATKVNFANEVEKFWPDCPVPIKYTGIESISSSDVTYLDALSYTDNDTMLIVDECHMAKSPDAIRANRIVDVSKKCSNKLIMTGTPITNNVHDMYMQYMILSELILKCSRWSDFEKLYVVRGGICGDQIIGYKNLDYLTGLAEPYTYMINSKDCLELPSLKTKTYNCDLTENQQEWYDEKKEELLKLIEDDDVEASDIFRILTEMQKIACGYVLKKDKSIEFLGTNKYELLDTVIDDSQVIIFCKYLFEVDLVVEYYGREKCAVFTGNNRNERQQELEAFTAGRKQYFVATMSSGGTGLNGLQVCDHVVFFSHSFKYFEYKQCVGRIERKGQTRKMYVSRFVTDSGIDRKIIANIERKRDLADEIQELLLEKTLLKKYVDEL